MKISVVLAASLVFPGMLFAGELVAPKEFQALSENRTQYFERNGEFYGAEQFFSDRTSLWQYSDGTCTRGTWYPQGDEICFVYDSSPTPQCWHFSKRNGTYYARIAGLAEGDPSELRLSKVDDEPLPCPGPDFGA